MAVQSHPHYTASLACVPAPHHSLPIPPAVDGAAAAVLTMGASDDESGITFQWLTDNDALESKLHELLSENSAEISTLAIVLAENQTAAISLVGASYETLRAEVVKLQGEKAGLVKQNALASALGTTATTVSDLIRGKYKLRKPLTEQQGRRWMQMLAAARSGRPPPPKLAGKPRAPKFPFQDREFEQHAKLSNYIHAICRTKQRQGGRFGKQTSKVVVDHINTHMKTYNPDQSTPLMTTKILRSWMNSNGCITASTLAMATLPLSAPSRLAAHHPSPTPLRWKQSQFNEEAVRSSPRKRSRDVADGLELPDEDEDDDDDDDDEEEAEDEEAEGAGGEGSPTTPPTA